MDTIEAINALRSREHKTIIAAAEKAADLLEEIEERLYIVGEILSDNQWNYVEEEAKRRINNR